MSKYGAMAAPERGYRFANRGSINLNFEDD